MSVVAPPERSMRFDSRVVTGSAAKDSVGRLAPFTPAVLMVALWLLWIASSGGYFPQVWYPSAVAAAVLLVVTVVARDQVLPAHRSARVALLAFVALVALSYLSILWSGSKDGALAASNKLLLYLVVAWTLAILPWTPKTIAVLLGAWSLAIAGFCAMGLLQATSAVHLDPFFVQLRYSTPLQYPNATAALAVMGMWPALVLSVRRELPSWTRAACLAIAVFLSEFALLPQSRAGLVGLVLTAPLALAVSSARFRLLVRFAFVGGGLALSVPQTVAVDNAIAAGRRVAPVLRHAAAGMLVTSAGALVLGGLVALAEDRIVLPAAIARVRRPLWGGRVRVAAVLVVLLVLGAGSLAAAPRVSHLANSVLQSGRTDASTGAAGSTRLLSTSPEERFDYIRVAAHLFAGSPIFGVGAGNFGRRYDTLRRLPKHSQYAHNVELRTLSETGILGFALFAVIVVSLAFGLARATKELDGLGRACSAAALLIAAYFLIHASLDWVDEFPALAAPALALPLAVIQTRPRGVLRESEEARMLTRHAPKLTARASVRALAGAATIILGLSVGLALYGPYLSNRYVNHAMGTFRVQSARAYQDLSRAAALNPWSSEPPTTEGNIAEQLGDFGRAHAAFARALALQRDWYPWLQLGLLDASNGRFAAASSELHSAASLDVHDPFIAQAKQLVAQRQRIDPVQFNQLMLQGPNTSLFEAQNLK